MSNTTPYSDASGSIPVGDKRESNWRQKFYDFVTDSVSNKRFYWLLALLMLPSFWAGFIADDHIHATRFVAEDVIPPTQDASLFGVFSVSDGREQTTLALMDKGLMPWWTHPNFRFQMWRPLSELSHWIDYQLWPQVPFVMHVHHLLWVLLMLWVVMKFWRKFVGESRLVALSFVLFAISANLSQDVVWLASRNTVMGAFFGIAAVLLHVKGRETGDYRLRIAAVASFAMGLGSSEFGLSASTWLFAWTFVLDGGSLLRRVVRLMPYGIVMLGWAAVYVVYGQGAEFSEFYIDPVHSPGAYALGLIERIPKIVFLSLTGLPPGFLGSVEPGGSGWLVGAAFTTILIILSWRSLREARWRFLLIGALLSILPIAAGPSGGRTVLLVSLGLLPMVARLLRQWAQQDFGSAQTALLTRVLAWPVFVLMMMSVIVIPATVMLYYYNDSKNVTGPALRLPITAEDADKNVVLLNPNSIFFANLFPYVRATNHLPMSNSFYPLASGQRDFKIERDAQDSLIITPVDGFMVETQSYFVRPRTQLLREGEFIQLTNLGIEPLSFTDDGRPLSVRFTFPGGVASSDYKILQCDRMEFVLFSVPAIGESVTIPPCER